MSRQEEQQPHVLVATLSRCPDCPADDVCDECREFGDLDFAIECPGVTQRCRRWEGCMDCSRRAREDKTGAFGELLHEQPVHGVQHQWIGGIGFCTPTDHCAVQLADGLPDCAVDVAAEPGRYPVDFDFDDGELSVLAPLDGAR